MSCVTETFDFQRRTKKTVFDNDKNEDLQGMSDRKAGGSRCKNDIGDNDFRCWVEMAGSGRRWISRGV